MILTDTGYWYALGNKKDRHHRRALEVSFELQEDPITTWPVVTETSYLLQRSLGVAAATRFLDSLHQSCIEIFHLEYDYFPRIRQLMRKYSDLPMDLADASLVILAENLGMAEYCPRIDVISTRTGGRISRRSRTCFCRNESITLHSAGFPELIFPAVLFRQWYLSGVISRQAGIEEGRRRAGN